MQLESEKSRSESIFGPKRESIQAQRVFVATFPATELVAAGAVVDVVELETFEVEEEADESFDVVEEAMEEELLTV